MTSPSSATWKPEIDALLNTITDATIMRDEFRERMTALLESARASGVEEAAKLLEDGARVSELHARETICPQTRDRFLHLASFERLHAEDIRALITGAGEGETK